MTNEDTGAAGSFQALEDFPVRSTDKLRYGDTDRQGHVNNAVFSTFLETGRVDLFHATEGDMCDEGAAFVIARLELDFLGEVNWPGMVEIGTVVETIGRSSVRLYQIVYQDGQAVARAGTVIVQMDETTRKSRAFSERVRQRLLAYACRAAGA